VRRSRNNKHPSFDFSEDTPQTSASLPSIAVPKNDVDIASLLTSLPQFIGQLGFSACRITNSSNQIHVYVSEKEWPRVASLAARQEKELLEAPHDGGVLPIIFVNAGIGNIQHMTDAWLAQNPMRCIKQAVFPYRKIELGVLSSIRNDATAIGRNRLFGPLEVKDVSTDRFGRRRAKLSDGHQIIQSAPIPDYIPEIALHQRLSVRGTLRISHYSQRIELVVHNIAPAPVVVIDKQAQQQVVTDLKIVTPTWSRSSIATSEELKGIIPTLLKAPRLFLDIETARDPFNTSSHKITLIQIGDPCSKHVFLIEGAALDSLDILKPWLESKEHEKVIHFAPFEKERFAERAIYLNCVTDTRDLVQTYYPHLPNRALGFCLRWILGIAADKSLQDSKWEPPFSAQQYDYAHLDVELLSDLYDAVSAFAAQAEQAIPQDATLEEYMQILNALDEQIAKLGENEPLLKAKQLELAAIEEAMTAALEQGQCSYDGPFGSYDLGRYIRVIDPKQLKKELTRREIFSDEKKAELTTMLCVSVDTIQKIREALDPKVKEAFDASLPQALAPLETSPRYDIFSRTAFQSFRKKGAATHDEQKYKGLLVTELARMHSETTAAILEMVHGGISDLLSCLGQRAVLCQRIAQYIDQGDTYEGAYGIARRRQKLERYAWKDMKDLITDLYDRYQSFDRTKIIRDLEAFVPRPTARIFLESLNELDPDQIDKILIVASTPTTKRDKSFFRPGVHDAL
jgi:hypothetical protein